MADAANTAQLGAGATTTYTRPYGEGAAAQTLTVFFARATEHIRVTFFAMFPRLIWPLRCLHLLLNGLIETYDDFFWDSFREHQMHLFAFNLSKRTQA